MKIINIHEREFPFSAADVGALIDSLSSREERLWPKQTWPPMKFDRPLAIGAVGGHGPIRYVVEEYIPGQSITFRFTGPKGFHGFHQFEVKRSGENAVLLRHTLQMKINHMALLSWPLIFCPLHDALIEDSLATAQMSLGISPQIKSWSPWVRFLRFILSKSRANF